MTVMIQWYSLMTIQCHWYDDIDYSIDDIIYSTLVFIIIIDINDLNVAYWNIIIDIDDQ